MALVVPRFVLAVVVGVVSCCRVDDDCQLNGECAGGFCACDPGWTGAACEALDLVAPDAVVPAYPPPEEAASTTSWGGSVAKMGDTYHLFVSEMSDECGMATWQSNSFVRHATAAAPEGPFRARERVMSQFSHNPTIARAPDGTFVLYHVGCGTPERARCTACAGGVTSASCLGAAFAEANGLPCTGNVTNVLYASSLDGPWDSLNAAVVPSAEMGKSWGPARMLDNPTVVFYEDGSLLMASRGGKPGDEAWSDGIVTAPSWRGPYTQHSMIGNASSPRVEDPFLWRDTKGFYHVIFHKFTDEHPNCGGHAFSRDGFHWTLSNSVALTTTVTTADGAEHAFQRRERPHLLFDDDGRPAYLYTSLTNWTVGALGTDKAFTFAQRIRVV